MISHVSAIEDGALQVVLSLCEYEMPVSLLSVRILGLIVEHPGTHQTVIENNRNTIPRILQLIASEDEQVIVMTVIFGFSTVIAEECGSLLFLEI